MRSSAIDAPQPPNRLSVRVAGALAEETEAESTLLDELLTDCAAEALSIRARILRRSRQLDELLGQSPNGRARQDVDALIARNQRAWEEWQALAELIGELRTRRRRRSS